MKFIFAFIAPLFLASCGMFGNFENPAYNVQLEEGDIQIRNYESKIIAQVEVEGDRDESLNKGFRLLADYIFGNNTTETDIAMTTPVGQSKDNSEEIAMTVPVTQKKSSDDERGKWVVDFTMPSKYTLETLPKPNNSQVEIVKTEPKKVAAITFSGFASSENFEENSVKLLDYLNKNNYEVNSTPEYLYYDPPWTPWFMKRNEVLVEIK